MEQIKIDSTLDSSHYEYVDGTDTIKIDTLKVLTESGDTTILVKEVVHDLELQIVEKLLRDNDYGGKLVSILILLFGLIAVLKRWKRKSKDK